ncbi:uncharacterized protein LOC129747298 [Uranotaenia lowii]|uniref:uncharacterized protein LOC129747298 n=3 Tax=Uranotaenia lowii TaxID=190385 RepID=UPI00247A0B82|nr:uncharacterized protein LOC129747298 [Uranotaenia lowii]
MSNKRGTVEVSCTVCRQPDDSRMVACDSCELWFHFACVKEDSSVQDREWNCEKCLVAANQVPAGTSTPTNNTGAIPKSGLMPTDSRLEEYVQQQLSKQLSVMQEMFDRMMREKEEQQAKELNDQRKMYEQRLKDAERRVMDQVSSRPCGGPAAGSRVEQASQMANAGPMRGAVRSPSSVWPLGCASAASASAYHQVTRDEAFYDVSRNQPLPWQIGVGPTASSTTNPLPQVNVAESSHGYDVLAHELKLLEDKQALERKHLEERRQLLNRQSVIDGSATGGGAGLNSQPTTFQPNVSSFSGTIGGGSRPHAQATAFESNYGGSFGANSFGIGFHPQARSAGGFGGYPMLSQNQISARQVLNKELPVFTGNPEEWPLFIASFESSSRICGFSDEENMLRLQRSLKGKALEAVRCRLLHPQNLAGVIETLRTLFGRPEAIVYTFIRKIREMPAPKEDKLQTVIDFGVAVQNVCAAISASGLDEYMFDVALLQELISKLPTSIRMNWAFYRQGLARVTLWEFSDWLGKVATAASTITLPSINPPKIEKRERKNENFINVHSEASGGFENPVKERSVTVSKAKGCVSCSGECSGLEQCRKFLKLDIGSRWTIIKEQNLCRKCLRKHFGACKVKEPCGRNGCTYKHNKLLHDDKRYSKPAASESTKSSNDNSSSNSTTQSCNTHSKATRRVLFRYVPVTIYGKGKQVNTFAFLDDGSSATLMEHGLLKELGLNGTPYPLCLDWTGGQSREEKESVVLALKISGTTEASEVFELSEVHTVKDLSLPKQSVSVPQMVTKYGYLDGLPLRSYEGASPRILIGMNNCRLGSSLRSLEGDENEPMASKTRLGWILYGPCTAEFGVNESDYSGYHSFHICPCNKDSEKDVHEALKEYFSIESMGIYGSSRSLLSKDEERALKILSTETRLIGNRYETGLLWRYDQLKLPNSKGMALKRLACLEKRLKREPELAAAMSAKMSEYEEKGYIRRLSIQEKAEKHPNDWYLPIFPVTNPNKPGKMRIVFDAAAKVNEVSLNSFLLTGPDQLVSLLTVLFKFREFRIAVVGDIREMFFQVKMKKQDQRSQMILWPNTAAVEDPEVYVVTVMTFGAACSPSSAHYVKNRNADRFEEQHPRAVQCIKYEHYVDDMLASVETEEDATKLAEEVRWIHAQGGFEIRNWHSNSSYVIENLQEKPTVEKNMSFCPEMSTEKVLGMWWDTTTDTFTFKLSPKHDAELLSGARMPTKREVLRTLMTVYDPMGLIGNFLIYLKILLQEIWRSGTGWDDEIDSRLTEKWLTWIEALPNVRQVTIPRCYRTVTSIESTNSVELHVFCDASENGIAAVAYFKFQEGDKAECALIGSKTRVAPLKFLSIPRLELQAAVVGARFADSIVKSHRMKITRRVFWTDSRDVVCWLRSDHRRYSQFVAFRVSELLDTTQVGEWRWLPTKQNVADEGTKWQRLPNFQPSSRWFRGPDFLLEPEDSWPGDAGDQGTTMEEIRASVLHHQGAKPLIISFERFSKWQRLLRSVGYLHRYFINFQNTVRKTTLVRGALTQEELKSAENTIYRCVQQQAYSDEVRLIRSRVQGASPWERTLPKSSALYKLNPVIDEHGVLRMQGRIGACEWADEATKNPVILPRQHHVTNLLIADYHAKYHHQNHQTALNEIRLKYNIPRLRSELDRVRRNCLRCKIRQASPRPPAMGNLPPARLAAYQRPFSYTGIDYFGPMTVLVGRRTEKRWGVLFTCMTTRGIHIEIAHSLSTDSCILALRNFIARRGPPLEIISDRGTNFIGASRELREALAKIDEERLKVEFVSPDTKWTFNPPAAPHFGGCWERLIQSVKKTMNDFDPPRLPSDEILRSMLMEIEMILNSRPLTDIPIDNDNEPPLTPNHFLLGSSNGSKPPIVFDNTPITLKRSWTMAQQYADLFWKKWVNEYLPTLTRRTKWFQPVKPIQEGDLVMVVDNNLPRNCWPRGRVIKAVPAHDGQVRRVTVQTLKGLLERPATKVAVLDVGATGGKPQGQ